MATFRIDGKPYDSAFVFVERGYNFKPTEMQAAFGLKQLDRLNSFIRIRRKNFDALYSFFERYRAFFVLPEEEKSAKTNWLAFPLTVKESMPFTREAIVQYLEDCRIQTRPLFSGNILKHPAYREIEHRRVGNLNNAQYILGHSFLIGLHHGLTPVMLDYVKEVFDRFLRKY